VDVTEADATVLGLSNIEICVVETLYMPNPQLT
jgi:hypothetical protein